MRHCMAQITRLVSAEDGDPGVREKHRIGHRRIIILVAVVWSISIRKGLKVPLGVS
jgi:hypothetical protein